MNTKYTRPLVLTVCIALCAGCLKTNGLTRSEAKDALAWMLCQRASQSEDGYKAKSFFKQVKELYGEMGFIDKEKIKSLGADGERREMREAYNHMGLCKSSRGLSNYTEAEQAQFLRKVENTRQNIKGYYLKKEEATFKRRTVNRKICRSYQNQPDTVFSIAGGYASPAKNCIYKGDVSLKVFQVTSKGALARVPHIYGGKDVVFIYNRHGILDNAVDGTRMAAASYYTYEGIYSYTALAGKRTVHSYAPMKSNPFKNLSFYRPDPLK